MKTNHWKTNGKII